MCCLTLCMIFMKQENNTALAWACQEFDLTTVSVLLRAGAYTNTCNKVISFDCCIVMLSNW